MNWDCVDLCCYINLKHQEDGKKHIENELKKIGFPSQKIKRINAVYKPLNGFQGNCLSQLECLNIAIEKKAKNVLILEDDTTFTKTKPGIINYIEECIRHFDKSWDVLMLGSNIAKYENTSHPSYKRILLGSCSHAYLVNQHYLQSLSNFFVWAYENVLIREPIYTQTMNSFGAHDVLWQIMTQKDQWIIRNEQCTSQRHKESSLTCPKGGKIVCHTIDHPAKYELSTCPNHWNTSTSPFN